MVTYLQVHEWMAQANLLIQFVILLLIILSVILQRKKKVLWHGNVIMVAVIINGLTLIMHMGPTFISVVREGIYAPNFVSFVGLAHGIIGAVALLFGLHLVAKWTYLGSETKECVKKRKRMVSILVFWLVSLGLGYIYYALHLLWS
jgi:hypothetical protein